MDDRTAWSEGDEGPNLRDSTAGPDPTVRQGDRTERRGDPTEVADLTGRRRDPTDVVDLTDRRGDPTEGRSPHTDPGWRPPRGPHEVDLGARPVAPGTVAPTIASPVGLMLDGWLVGKPLGAPGGQATVYRATKGAKAIAIRFVTQEDAGSRRRLADEVEIWKDVKHAHIAEYLWDRPGVRGRPPEHYVAIELCGPSLHSRLNRFADLAQRRTEAWTLAPAVAEACRRALQYLHQDHRDHQLVHRDLKPGNVLLGLDRRWKLADFGISVAASPTTPRPARTVIGTTDYTPPAAVARSAPVTPGIDHYALGALVQWMFTNEAGPDLHPELPAEWVPFVEASLVAYPAAWERVRWVDLIPSGPGDHPRSGARRRDVAFGVGGRRPRSVEPFSFGGESYDDPGALATAFRRRWADAVAVLGDDAERRLLSTFLADHDHPGLVDSIDGADEVLMRLLVDLDPDGPARLDQIDLDPGSLRRLALAAITDDDAWDRLRRVDDTAALRRFAANDRKRHLGQLHARWQYLRAEADRIPVEVPRDARPVVERMLTIHTLLMTIAPQAPWPDLSRHLRRQPGPSAPVLTPRQRRRSPAPRPEPPSRWWDHRPDDPGDSDVAARRAFVAAALHRVEAHRARRAAEMDEGIGLAELWRSELTAARPFREQEAERQRFESVGEETLVALVSTAVISTVALVSVAVWAATVDEPGRPALITFLVRGAWSLLVAPVSVAAIGTWWGGIRPSRDLAAMRAWLATARTVIGLLLASAGLTLVVTAGFGVVRSLADDGDGSGWTLFGSVVVGACALLFLLGVVVVASDLSGDGPERGPIDVPEGGRPPGWDGFPDAMTPRQRVEAVGQLTSVRTTRRR